MKPNLYRGLIGALLVVLLAAGCSRVRMGYDWADFLIGYQLDDLFDLSSEQEEATEALIDAELAWHRAEELPKYAAFLGQITKAVETGLTEAELDRLFGHYQTLRASLFSRLVPLTAAWLAQLEPHQVAHFKAQLAERNEEIAEELEEPREKRQEERIEKGIERMEDWLGYLSAKQEIQARQFFAGLKLRGQARLDFRLESQRAFFKALESEGPKTKALEAVLREYWLDVYQRQPLHEYHRIILSNQRAYKDFLLELYTTLEPRQKEHLITKGEKLRADLIALANNPL